MSRHCWKAPSVSILVLGIFLCLAEGGGKVEVKGSMGNKKFCRSAKDKVKWLSEKSSALIIGKSEAAMAKDCSVIFGAAVEPSKSVRLRLNFDFIYFDNCGVKLQINQSSSSDFAKSKDNKEIFMSGCNHQNPGPLYAQPKHYVLLSLRKTSNRLEGYNFRLNVSMAEHLPVTGAPLRVVIIVAFVCFVVVAGAAFVLFKYASHLSMEWGDERRVEAMDRAIYLYSSSGSREPSGDGGESTMALMEPGHGLIARQPPRPTIGFVHSDGTVIRFQPLDHREPTRQEVEDDTPPSHADTADPNHPQSPPRSKGRQPSPSEEPTHFYLSFSQHHSQQWRQRQPQHSSLLSSDTADTNSIGGGGVVDVPPSYEEALAMPISTCGGAVGGGYGSGSSIQGACGGGGGIRGSRGKPKTGKGKGKKKFPKPDSDRGRNDSHNSTDTDNRSPPPHPSGIVSSGWTEFGEDEGGGEEEEASGMDRGLSYMNFEPGNSNDDNNGGVGDGGSGGDGAANTLLTLGETPDVTGHEMEGDGEGEGEELLLKEREDALVVDVVPTPSNPNPSPPPPSPPSHQTPSLL